MQNITECVLKIKIEQPQACNISFLGEVEHPVSYQLRPSLLMYFLYYNYIFFDSNFNCLSISMFLKTFLPLTKSVNYILYILLQNHISFGSSLLFKLTENYTTSPPYRKINIAQRFCTPFFISKDSSCCFVPISDDIFVILMRPQLSALSTCYLRFCADLTFQFFFLRKIMIPDILQLILSPFSLLSFTNLHRFICSFLLCVLNIDTE